MFPIRYCPVAKSTNLVASDSTNLPPGRNESILNVKEMQSVSKEERCDRKTIREKDNIQMAFLKDTAKGKT